MDIEHDVGANQRQKLVVALDVLGMVGKTRAAKIRLGQFALLDHGAHRPIQDQYAFAEQARKFGAVGVGRSEEHTSELQSLMRISYAVSGLKKKTQPTKKYH